MSYANMPDGFYLAYEAHLRREEVYDEALAAKEAELWDSAMSPLVADEMALHAEVGAENLGSLLCLAAYAKAYGRQHDKDGVIDSLIELFQSDIERVARYEVSKEI
jgi:hypothetical protein